MGRVTLPCGCDTRRDVMFAYGNPGITELAIIGAGVTAIIAAIVYRRTRA